MLHILLLILKIIGIIFAVILGILVLLACVVLYVPVRYDLEASCDGTFAGIHARAGATWLLHLVGLHVCYENKELSWRVRIAWKSIKSGQEKKKTIKTEVETYDEEMEELWEDVEKSLEEESGERVEEESEETGNAPEKIREESTEALEGKVLEEKEEQPGEALEGEEEQCGEALEGEEERSGEVLEGEEERSGEALEEKDEQSCKIHQEDSGQVKEGSRRRLEEDSGCEEIPEEGEAGSEEKLEEDHGSSGEDKKPAWRKIADICQKLWQKITGLYQKIVSLPGRIKDIIRNIRDKIKALSEKKDKILAFLTDEVHKKAFVKVKDEIWRLLQKLRPKKLLAEIHYGFEDPSLTGRLLAGISIVYPFLGEGVRVYPDFERKVFNGQVKIAGKIRGSYFVWLLWRLVWCKEVRMTYRHVRDFRL